VRNSGESKLGVALVPKRTWKECENYGWDWVLAILAARWDRHISGRHKNKGKKESMKKTLMYRIGFHPIAV